MNSTHYDVIISGGGLLGMSAAYAFVKAGKKALVVESGDKINPDAASYGDVRVTRHINEEPVLNETAAASRKMMRDIQEEAGLPIIQPMPAVFMMKKSSDAYANITQGITAESGIKEISREQLLEQYGVHPGEGYVGIVDSNAAAFNPAEILQYQRKFVEEHGGAVYYNTPVTSWMSNENGAEVHTENSKFTCEQIIIATGAWTPDVLDRGNGDNLVAACVREAMVLERVPVFYFDYPDIPSFIPVIVSDDGKPDIYAVPEGWDDGKLIKVGFHHGTEVDSLAKINRQIGREEIQKLRKRIEPLLGKKLNYQGYHVCHYAKVRDSELPLIGALPGSKRVFLLALASGTGAKHALAYGAALYKITRGEAPDQDIRGMAVERILHPSLMVELQLSVSHVRLRARAAHAHGL